MINKVAKGNRVELMARKELEKEGYLVDKKPRTKFQSPDLFGYFDLIALKGAEIRLIQVKSNVSHFYTARKEIKKWVIFHDVKIPCECWLYLGDKLWRKENVLHISYTNKNEF